jgi:putative hydrolase of the HAD superfamily
MEEQRKSSRERYPEFDAVAIWSSMLQALSLDSAVLPAEKIQQLPRFLAELHRALSHKRLQRYPGVREVLDELGKHYALGIITDAQSAYAVPELRTAGLGGLFACHVVSGDFGYRKPDQRLFAAGMQALGVRPEQAIYVGNDMYHDVFGAQQAGMRAVFWPTQFGKKVHANVAPDYIIYSFEQLCDAVSFLAAR